MLTRGDLSSLRWIASPLRHFVTSNPNVQLCRVYFSSLNFRDIMLATGKLPPDAIPGRECVEDTTRNFAPICISSQNNSNPQLLVGFCCYNRPHKNINNSSQIVHQVPTIRQPISPVIVHCVGDLALQQCMLGMEFSGRDPIGQRVMGLLPAKGLATSVDADKRFLWDIPSSWSVSQF